MDETHQVIVFFGGVLFLLIACAIVLIWGKDWD